MKAKYRSLCVRCRYAILPGEEIDWARGVGTVHSLCLSSGMEVLTGSWPAGAVVRLSDGSWWVVVGEHVPGAVKARPATLEEIRKGAPHEQGEG